MNNCSYVYNVIITPLTIFVNSFLKYLKNIMSNIYLDKTREQLKNYIIKVGYL